MARRSQDGTVKLTADEFAKLAQGANEAQSAGLVDETDAEADLAASAQDQENDVLQSLLEVEGAGDCRWQIHRLGLANERPGFVTEMGSSDLTLANIARLCGPGKYRIRGFRANGRYAGMRTIQIAEPAPNVPGATASAGNSSAVADVLAIIAAEKAKSSENWKSWALVLAPVLAAPLVDLVKSFFTRKETTLTEMTQALANLKSLSGDNQSQLSKIEELGKLIEMVKAIAGDAKETTGRTWIDAVVEGVKEVGPVVAGAFQRPAQPGLGAPVIPPVTFAPSAPLALTPGVAPPPAAAGGTDPMMALIQWLQGELPRLIAMAARDRDPELYAEVLLDGAPVGIDPKMVHDFLVRPDWWAMLTRFAPAAAPYQGWFGSLRDTLVATLAREIRQQSRQSEPPATQDEGVNTNE